MLHHTAGELMSKTVLSIPGAIKDRSFNVLTTKK